MIQVELTEENKKLIESKEYSSAVINIGEKTITLYQGDEPPKAIIEETEEQSKIDISGVVDINTLTDEQVLKLKTRLGL